ncbi:hypothetical protein [Kitasatospora sp. CB02891]|uniref:hypothetical protein n=1 Tax=Kitasatospora sp. CB02891 TaxID=2020329 RepID=UPI000C2726E8|nr:hypothetical protein [Kitasatospora sp. CB02891]PJN23986.1 hypothetical protein CG736_18960 [Kitasatospora sp. CB02891]
MKRALALVAVTAAALFAAAPLASATTVPAPAGSATQLSVGLPNTPLDGDTSWGGACETPLCKPWS